MGASDRRRRTLPALAIALAATGLSLVACDAILGLGSYTNVSCAFDCGVEETGPAAEAGGLAIEAGLDATTDARDAEAGSDAEAAADSAIPFDEAGLDGPPLTELWAHWPMPNPDAGEAPESSIPLPSPMKYDAGADGGSLVVYDDVTHLTWWRATVPAGGEDAQSPCDALAGGGWHVPTRIELVSLVDFTVASGATINQQAFPEMKTDYYLTSSPYAGESGQVWSVDFNTGLVGANSAPPWVLCVREP
jgi:Protein of unknown function (DUF1566)